MHQRIQFTACLLILTAGLSLLPGCTTPPRLGFNKLGRRPVSYVFFADSQPACRIVTPAAPEPEELLAAQELLDTLQRIGGVTIPLVADPAPDAAVVSIHVGRTDLARQVSPYPDTLDADGFAIHPLDGQTLILLGGRPVSTFYAVCEFLERYAGVLWVWPGDHGSVIPRQDRLQVEVVEQLSEPAFRARRFSGMGRTTMRYYRIHATPRERRSEFHHNVFKVLPAETYWDTHPEYYAEIEGQRQKPASRNANWQACTSNPEVAGLFIAAAKKQFQDYPWNLSFSVSQNDGGGFCRCAACKAQDIPGQEGISDRYFDFMNRVADGIRDEFPDKVVSCLAYGQATRNIPSRISLRPNTMIYAVIPTLEDQHEDIRRWSRVAPTLGVYFWLHGKAVPKFYPTRFAEYLRFLRRHAVKEVYAEVYQDNPERLASFALDGPRVWITAKLLWDPDADVEALLRMFCERFYGPAAAPMQRYYRHCEMVWERRADPFDFGRRYRELEFDTYTAADMDLLEACLHEALRLADSPAVAARLSMQRDALAKAALYVRQLALPEQLASMPLQTKAHADAIVATVAQAERTSRDMAAAGQSFFGGMAQRSEEAIDAVFEQISAALGEQAAPYWRAQRSTNPELQRFFDTQLLDIQGNPVNVIRNPGFETTAKTPGEGNPELDWRGLDAPGWNAWLRPGTRGQVRISSHTAKTGNRALEIHGCEAACGLRSLQVREGQRYRVTAYAKTTTPREADNPERQAATMTLKWQDSRGKWLNTPPDVLRAIYPGDAQWQALSATVTIPANVGRLVILLGAAKQDTEEMAWFDDCLVELLHDPQP